MAAKLVDNLQMVGHLKCKAEWCIKSFEAKRGIKRTPSNPNAYRPACFHSKAVSFAKAKSYSHASR